MGKGKYIRTSEIIERNRISMKKVYDSGYMNPNKGKVFPKEFGEKISSTHKKSYANGYVNPMKGKHNSGASIHMKIDNPMRRKETRDKVSKTLKRRYSTDLAYLKQRTSERDKQMFKNRVGFGKRFSQSGLKAQDGRISKIEILLKNELQRRNIDCRQQFFLNGRRFDFKLPNNVLVECDGNYWHNYPEGNENDRLKDRISEENGFVLCRFWETEINNDASACVDFIQNMINRGGQ